MTMAMELIRHIAGLYSGKAIKGDFTQVYITGNEIWMAQQVLAEQAEGAQGERERFEAWYERTYGVRAFAQNVDHSYVEPLTEMQWAGWQARAALAQPSPVPELERPEVVAWSNWKVGTRSHVPFRTEEEAERSVSASEIAATQEGPYSVEPLMTVSQHKRIDAARLASVRVLADEVLELAAQRDAAQARVAELEKQEPVATVAKVPGEDWNGLHFYRDLQGMQPGTKLYAAPVAQAQHSVPEWTSSKPAVEGAYWVRGNGLVEPFVVLVKLDQGELWCNLHMRNTDTNFGYGYAVDDLSSEFEWCGPLAAATVKEVPQAWLDVQAERRRQITAEGWTPEHDDEHSHGQMARAAACYALAGSSAPNDGTAALLVSLAWPWDEQWWKPTTTRRDLVKACALGLAEIERLDRAAAPGKEVGHE